jgi:hypothetical protein
MRSDMLDYPATMSSATRIGVISQDSDVGIATKLHLTIRIYNRFGTPSASRHKLSIHLSINRYGKTSVKPKKRVKVKPDRWCGWCGAFDGVGSNQGCWRCREAGSYRQWWESDADGTPWAVDRWSNSQNGRSVQDYLPPDVSLEDFEKAQSYLEAGYEISLYTIASRLGKLTAEERPTFNF